MPATIQECSSCGDTVTGSLYATYDNRHICESCYENEYFTCNECERVLHQDNYEEDGLCNTCYQRENRVIQDASFMPRLNFHKEAWENTLYQGIELEIELPSGHAIESHAERFRTWLERERMAEYLYFKNDGSLSNGYEIVSHPFTSRARHKLMRWHKVLEYLRGSGASAFRTSTCGLHVHVSRQALTIKDICKLKLFFWVNKYKIEKVAGRSANSYCKFQPFGMTEYRLGDISGHNERYLVINVNERNQSKKTVEFRIFKATIQYPRFLACLQFVEAICDYVKNEPVDKLAGPTSWPMFTAWVKKAGRFNQLVKHFKKVGV